MADAFDTMFGGATAAQGDAFDQMFGAENNGAAPSAAQSGSDAYRQNAATSHDQMAPPSPAQQPSPAGITSTPDERARWIKETLAGPPQWRTVPASQAAIPPVQIEAAAQTGDLYHNWTQGMSESEAALAQKWPRIDYYLRHVDPQEIPAGGPMPVEEAREAFKNLQAADRDAMAGIQQDVKTGLWQSDPIRFNQRILASADARAKLMHFVNEAATYGDQMGMVHAQEAQPKLSHARDYLLDASTRYLDARNPEDTGHRMAQLIESQADDKIQRILDQPVKALSTDEAKQVEQVRTIKDETAAMVARIENVTKNRGGWALHETVNDNPFAVGSGGSDAIDAKLAPLYDQIRSGDEAEGKRIDDLHKTMEDHIAQATSTDAPMENIERAKAMRQAIASTYKVASAYAGAATRRSLEGAGEDPGAQEQLAHEAIAQQQEFNGAQRFAAGFKKGVLFLPNLIGGSHEYDPNAPAEKGAEDMQWKAAQAVDPRNTTAGYGIGRILAVENLAALAVGDVAGTAPFLADAVGTPSLARTLMGYQVGSRGAEVATAITKNLFAGEAFSLTSGYVGATEQGRMPNGVDLRDALIVGSVPPLGGMLLQRATAMIPGLAEAVEKMPRSTQTLLHEGGGASATALSMVATNAMLAKINNKPYGLPEIMGDLAVGVGMHFMLRGAKGEEVDDGKSPAGGMGQNGPTGAPPTGTPTPRPGIGPPPGMGGGPTPSGTPGGPTPSTSGPAKGASVAGAAAKWWEARDFSGVSESVLRETIGLDKDGPITADDVASAGRAAALKYHADAGGKSANDFKAIMAAWRELVKRYGRAQTTQAQKAANAAGAEPNAAWNAPQDTGATPPPSPAAAIPQPPETPVAVPVRPKPQGPAPSRGPIMKPPPLEPAVAKPTAKPITPVQPPETPITTLIPQGAASAAPGAAAPPPPAAPAAPVTEPNPPKVSQAADSGTEVAQAEPSNAVDTPEVSRISDMLARRMPEIPAANNLKTARHISLAINTGLYNDMMAPNNRNSRAVFTELTGVKLPTSLNKTKEIFTGKPFPVKAASPLQTSVATETTPTQGNDESRPGRETIMGTPSKLIRSEVVDGVKFELFRAEGGNGKAAIRRTDESGETLPIHQYPDFNMASKAFEDAIAHGDIKSAPKLEPASTRNYGTIDAPNRAEPSPTQADSVKTPTSALADDLAARIAVGTPITSMTLTQAANHHFGGTIGQGKYTIKDAYDALELAVNKHIAANPQQFNPTVDLAKALKTATALTNLTNNLPTQTRRTGETQSFQQFSTPPAYAFAANWIANIQPGEQALEPSAGVGGIAVFGKNAGANVHVNELAPRRADALKALGFSNVTTENAEQIGNILKIHPTVVVMNPPFSQTAGRMGNKRMLGVAGDHIEQAFSLMPEGGRLVAIVGEGMKLGAPTYADFFRRMAPYLSANVGVSGDVYKKYGTTFGTRVLVFDNTAAPKQPVVGDVPDVLQLMHILQGVRDARIASTEQPPADAGVQNAPAQSGPQGTPSPRPVVSPPVGGMGAGPAAVPANRPQPPASPGLGSGQPSAGPSEAGTAPAVSQPTPTTGTGGQSAATPGTTGGPGSSGTGGEGTAPGLNMERPEEPAAPKEEISEATFENYNPKKVKITGAQPHPTALVESAAMASVFPPDPTYIPSLDQRVIDNGHLSSAQLEPIVYAGQAHNQMLPDGSRRGFFDGDGTGVGKGAIGSGIIMDNWNRGRKRGVWITENFKLLPDAQRDIEWVGGDNGILFPQNKIKAGNDITQKEGILFTGYGTLKSDVDGPRSRLNQIVKWLGRDFDGVILFDESHNMKNAMVTRGARGATKPSATALAGLKLQDELPNARVVYLSATGATEVANLAYAKRLGLWGQGTAFPDAATFVSEIQSGGIAAMELVARDMKQLGSYLARNLSFKGVSYEPLEHPLQPHQVQDYNKLTEAWQIVLCNINAALNITNGANSAAAKSAAYSAFWGGHQRFFNQVITAMQMPTMLKAIHEGLDSGHSILVQFTSTNEAALDRSLAKMEAEGGDIEDLDLTPRDGLMQMVRHCFPVHQYEDYIDDNDNPATRLATDSQGNPVVNREAVAMRDRLLGELASIRVPEGPLDQLFREFGSGMVAENTGRTQRVVPVIENGEKKMKREPRSSAHALADVNAFTSGKKRIMAYSKAGGTGGTYSASKTFKNQEPRLHFLAEAGWVADKAIQGLGRSHRSGQVSAPTYRLVTTDLPGQKRFISSIARRLGQLGAMTKGQRDAASSGIYKETDNLESAYARDALDGFYHDLYDNEIEGLDIQDFVRQTGLRLLDEHGQLLRDLPPITQFLNRLLSLDVETQHKVFDAFSTGFDEIVERAKANGTYDTGVEVVKAQKIDKNDEQTVYTDQRTGAETKMVDLTLHHLNRPLPWDQMGSARMNHKKPMMFGQNKRSGQIYAFTEGPTRTLNNGQIVDTYRKYSPGGTHENVIRNTITDDHWDTIGDETQQKKLWDEAVAAVPKTREEPLHMITGAILPIWDRLRGQPKVYRLQTSGGERLLGRVVSEADVHATLRALGVGAGVPKLTPDQALSAVITGGHSLTLANDWKIKRSRVGGEARMELIGPNYRDAEILRGLGVFEEQIQFRMRYFIPTENAESLGRILEYHPIADMQKGSGQPPVRGTDDASPSMSRSPTYSRPDLEKMTLPQLRAIANPLGIRSLSMKDLIDRILAKQTAMMPKEGENNAERAGRRNSSGQVPDGEGDGGDHPKIDAAPDAISIASATIQRHQPGTLDISYSNPTTQDELNLARQLRDMTGSGIVFFTSRMDEGYSPSVFGLVPTGHPETAFLMRDLAPKELAAKGMHEAIHILSKKRDPIYPRMVAVLTNPLKSANEFLAQADTYRAMELSPRMRVEEAIAHAFEFYEHKIDVSWFTPEEHAKLLVIRDELLARRGGETKNEPSPSGDIDDALSKDSYFDASKGIVRSLRERFSMIEERVGPRTAKGLVKVAGSRDEALTRVQQFLVRAFDGAPDKGVTGETPQREFIILGQDLRGEELQTRTGSRGTLPDLGPILRAQLLAEPYMQKAIATFNREISPLLADIRRHLGLPMNPNAAKMPFFLNMTPEMEEVMTGRKPSVNNRDVFAKPLKGDNAYETDPEQVLTAIMAGHLRMIYADQLNAAIRREAIVPATSVTKVMKNGEEVEMAPWGVFKTPVVQMDVDPRAQKPDIRYVPKAVADAYFNLFRHAEPLPVVDATMQAGMRLALIGDFAPHSIRIITHVGARLGQAGYSWGNAVPSWLGSNEATIARMGQMSIDKPLGEAYQLLLDRAGAGTSHTYDIGNYKGRIAKVTGLSQHMLASKKGGVDPRARRTVADAFVRIVKGNAYADTLEQDVAAGRVTPSEAAAKVDRDLTPAQFIDMARFVNSTMGFGNKQTRSQLLNWMQHAMPWIASESGMIPHEIGKLAGANVINPRFAKSVAGNIRRGEVGQAGKKLFTAMATGAAGVYILANLINFLVSREEDGEGRFLWQNPKGHRFDVQVWKGTWLTNLDPGFARAVRLTGIKDLVDEKSGMVSAATRHSINELSGVTQPVLRFAFALFTAMAFGQSKSTYMLPDGSLMNTSIGESLPVGGVRNTMGYATNLLPKPFGRGGKERLSFGEALATDAAGTAAGLQLQHDQPDVYSPPIHGPGMRLSPPAGKPREPRR